MPEDLSYLLDQENPEVIEAIRQTVEVEIIKAIAQYLVEVADTMKANKIECLNEPTVRAMAGELLGRFNLQPQPSGEVEMSGSIL